MTAVKQSKQQILQKIILFLFHFLLITTPFVFTWVNEELFEFNKMLFTYLVSLAIGLAWISRMIVEKRVIFKTTFLDTPLLLFLFSQLLSSIFSIHPRTSFFGYYTRFNGGLLSTITYIGLYYALVSNLDKKHLKPLFKSTILGGLLVSLYAIPEHFGHSASCWVITRQFDVSCWVQDVQSRVFASFGQPNWLAAYMIMLLPLGVGLLLAAKKKTNNRKVSQQRWFFTISLLAMFLTLLYTKSRSGLLGLGVGLGGLAVGVAWLKLRVKIVVPFFLGVALLTAVTGTPFSPSLQSLLSGSQQPLSPPTGLASSDPGGTESGDIRKIVWQGAVRVWRRYPWFGSGVETFAYSYYQDKPIEHNLVSEWDFLYNKAHNEFLNFLATTGIIGLGSYLFLLGTFLIYCVIYAASSHNTNSSKAIMLSLASGVIAVSVSNFFGFSTVMINILMFFLMAAAAIMGRKPSEDKAIKPTNITWWQGGLLALTTILTLSLANGVRKMWLADRHYADGKNLVQANQLTEAATRFQIAATLSPREALFFDELADTYSKLAVQYYQVGEATTSAELAQAAIQTSDYVIQLNPRHLNFRKTRARIFITMSQIELAVLWRAIESLNTAIELSPSDAKLRYNLGLVKITLGEIDQGIIDLQQAIDLKPNYATARFELGKQFESQNRLEEAAQQYQSILDSLIPDHQEIQQRLETIEASISAQN